MKAHNTASDLWVSFLGDVYDLTRLVEEHAGELAKPILEAAGTDISHWFDEKSGDVKSFIDPVTELQRPYVPQGRFVHVPPREPTSDWDTSFEKPWWKDEKYRVGRLPNSTRAIRVKNVLTGQEHLMTVPSEESIVEIRGRYLELNWHAESDVWKAMQKVGDDFELVELDMEKTLEENGIKDETEQMQKLGVDQDFYVPVIHLYYQDDLTTA